VKGSASSECTRERTLTPQRHEDGEEDGGRVVEEVAGARRPAGRGQLPVAARAVAQRTHGDVVPGVADLHAVGTGGGMGVMMRRQPL